MLPSRDADLMNESLSGGITLRLFTYVRWLMLAVVMMLCAAAPSFAQISVSVSIAPPELPVYEQPVCPGDDYIWTPGYWAWDGSDYFWVPGTWIVAPESGYLWTPPYWGWSGGSYVFYDGYWGPQIGFYGGVDYGFGYFGHGYDGGRWQDGHFFYNRSVTNVNVTNIHNVYDVHVDHTTVNRVSFNGPNGINERPTSQEEAASRGNHIPPVAAQTQHIQAARNDPQFKASSNHGKPPVAATSRPGEFSGAGAVPAREGGAVSNKAADTRTAGTENNAGRPAPVVHAKDIPPAERPAAPNTGNPQLDQKYQQQQTKLYSQQDKQRQQLQQKQDQDHARLAQQHASDAQTQQLEQKHQQQTQQLQQRHVQQQQQMQQKQQAHVSQPKPEEKH
jgi:hypothetical protein